MPPLTRIPVPHLPPDAPRWQRAAHSIAYSSEFHTVITAVIVLNALGIAVQTYSVPPWVNRVISGGDLAFVLIFTVELVIRLAAYRFNLKAFFSNGWNVFDTLVILAALVPGVTSNVTVLRIVRLLRVARLLRVMPDIRILMDGMRRAAGPASSLLGLTVLLCFIYGVIGTLLFAKTAPEYFGNLGEGMLTLFELLTLEGWNQTMNDLRAASPFGLLYVIIFILFGTYIVVNFVVGVVITSLDDAYQHGGKKPVSPTESDLTSTVRDLQESVERLTARLSTLEQPGATDRAEGDGSGAAGEADTGVSGRPVADETEDGNQG